MVIGVCMDMWYKMQIKYMIWIKNLSRWECKINKRVYKYQAWELVYMIASSNMRDWQDQLNVWYDLTRWHYPMFDDILAIKKNIKYMYFFHFIYQSYRSPLDVGWYGNTMGLLNCLNYQLKKISTNLIKQKW